MKNERVLRNIRKNFKTISDTLGEEYLKKKELYKSAYVCINKDFTIDDYFEGQSELPSPPSSKPPSAMKLSNTYIHSDFGKRSCKQASRSNQGLDFE